MTEFRICSVLSNQSIKAFFDYVHPIGVIARLDPKSGLPDFGTH